MSSNLVRKVIVDVDPGSDDAWALLLLVVAEKLFNIKILAITCTHGNGELEYVGRNTLMILKTLNRTDIPVYIGSEEPIVLLERTSDNYHGNDGFGDLPDYGVEADLSLLQKEHAVNAIARLVAENPNEITLFALGPLTNVALCMKLYPYVRDSLKELWIMGGNFLGIGNISKSAEFNFYMDPEAVDIVFKSTKCPVVIFPLEAGRYTTDFIIELEWRLNEVTANEENTRFLEFITLIENNIFETRNTKYWVPYDAVAVASYLRPEMILESRERIPFVELNGQHTRGQVVFDLRSEDKSNFIFIEKVDVNIFKETILFALNN